MRVAPSTTVESANISTATIVTVGSSSFGGAHCERSAYRPAIVAPLSTGAPLLLHNISTLQKLIRVVSPNTDFLNP